MRLVFAISPILFTACARELEGRYTIEEVEAEAQCEHSPELGDTVRVYSECLRDGDSYYTSCDDGMTPNALRLDPYFPMNTIYCTAPDGDGAFTCDNQLGTGAGVYDAQERTLDVTLSREPIEDIPACTWSYLARWDERHPDIVIMPGMY